MNKIMKTLLTILLIAMLTACSSTKKTEERVDPITERMLGIIHMDEVCGALIYTALENYEMVILPNNLDEKFKVEGMKVKFFFKNSSIPVPKGCKATVRGNVEELTPLR